MQLSMEYSLIVHSMCLIHSQYQAHTYILLYTGPSDETVLHYYIIVNTIQKHPGHKKVAAKTKKTCLWPDHHYQKFELHVAESLVYPFGSTSIS